MKIEFEEYSTIEDFFLYFIETEYTPEVKHLLPLTLYKGYVFSIVPLSLEKYWRWFILKVRLIQE